MSTEQVWLEDGTSRHFTAHEQQDAYGSLQAVEANTVDLLRWAAAEKAWQVAQAEMAALYKASYDLDVAIEQVGIDAEDREWAEQRAVAEAERVALEAAVDDVDGPRQYVLVNRSRWNPDGRSQRTLGFTVHHESCASARRLEDRRAEESMSTTSISGRIMRKPEAAALIGTRPDFNLAPVQACKRCCANLAGVSP